MALIDYDHDGLLDIYVNAIGPDILYHNLGGLQFTNVATQLGVATPGTGVGVVAADIDGNGWVDLFTGNRSFDLNRLYLNQGGFFVDATAAAGIDKVGLGMGVMALDGDNDQDLDLYWTTWPSATNAYYENQGNTQFVDRAMISGTSDIGGWGISCNAGDIDNDGWEDFFVTNGFDPSTTANVLFRNLGNGTYSNLTSVLGGATFDGRGVAFADFDNDGDMDLCVTADKGESTRLWRNDSTNSNHWIAFRLRGTSSNRSAIGARIEVETDWTTLVKEVSGGAGRGSFNSLPVEFGLGPTTTNVGVRIRWPSGILQTLSSLSIDQYHAITEPMRLQQPRISPSGIELTWPSGILQSTLDATSRWQDNTNAQSPFLVIPTNDASYFRLRIPNS